MMPSIKRKGMARPSPSPEASRRHALWLGLRFGRRRWQRQQLARIGGIGIVGQKRRRDGRSEEYTSELQSLMRISYAVFCLKKKKTHHTYAASLALSTFNQKC